MVMLRLSNDMIYPHMWCVIGNYKDSSDYMHVYTEPVYEFNHIAVVARQQIWV